MSTRQNRVEIFIKASFRCLLYCKTKKEKTLLSHCGEELWHQFLKIIHCRDGDQSVSNLAIHWFKWWP